MPKVVPCVDSSRTGFADAIEAARSADVVVMVVGTECPGFFFGDEENRSRQGLCKPGQ